LILGENPAAGAAPDGFRRAIAFPIESISKSTSHPVCCHQRDFGSAIVGAVA
jgi:hypothetical protein